MQYARTEIQMTDLSKEKVPREKVRGRPFEPGNPGRPPGSKNKATRLIEQLMADEATAIGRKLIERALNGDPKCIQLCVDRLAPKRHGRTIDFQLPAINGPQDIVAAMATIAKGLSNGDLTAEEAAQLVQVLDRYREALALHDIANRVEALESRAKGVR
jgi:hypothetical protein